MSGEGGALKRIQSQIMWNRLISVVEEQAQTLLRTAFSTTVREAGDLSAGVFDVEGRMLAQAVTGTPGHINAMAEAIVHFIKKFLTLFVLKVAFRKSCKKLQKSCKKVAKKVAKEFLFFIRN